MIRWGVNVKAAQLNGKQNWTAAIFGLAADDKWADAVDIANRTDSFEGICIVDTVTAKAEFDAMQSKATELTSKLGPLGCSSLPPVRALTQQPMD